MWLFCSRPNFRGQNAENPSLVRKRLLHRQVSREPPYFIVEHYSVYIHQVMQSIFEFIIFQIQLVKKLQNCVTLTSSRFASRKWCELRRFLFCLFAPLLNRTNSVTIKREAGENKERKKNRACFNQVWTLPYSREWGDLSQLSFSQGV